MPCLVRALLPRLLCFAHSWPPCLAARAKTGWWDLFDDTGQWQTESTAACDGTVCPYPVAASRCMPHPFICCDVVSRECGPWDGQDAGKCDSGLRWVGWDAMTQCEAHCG